MVDLGEAPVPLGGASDRQFGLDYAQLTVFGDASRLHRRVLRVLRSSGAVATGDPRLTLQARIIRHVMQLTGVAVLQGQNTVV